MNEKELRRLSRGDLLEILLNQTERIELLEKELAKTKKELANKKISISESGTLAEASLKVSDLFKKADESIEIFKSNYLSKVTKQFDKEKAAKLKEFEKICAKNQKESEKLVKDAKEKASKIISDAKKEKDRIVQDAKKEAEKLSKIIVNNTKASEKNKKK